MMGRVKAPASDASLIPVLSSTPPASRQYANKLSKSAKNYGCFDPPAFSNHSPLPAFF
jgi:hypothetical protein